MKDKDLIRDGLQCGNFFKKFHFCLFLLLLHLLLVHTFLHLVNHVYPLLLQSHFLPLLKLFCKHLRQYRKVCLSHHHRHKHLSLYYIFLLNQKHLRLLRHHIQHQRRQHQPVSFLDQSQFLTLSLNSLTQDFTPTLRSS